ncbi:hypothetical protein GCM10007385_13580 [Tateyamaria omphalii]|uniref:SH3 domain-containing protein n=1 Tax=Tateyamaria omphalii TaxID=299262 RepID=UPI0016747712|nr:SH3 domain-containing protein [Tateyamaria omphalii]GGX47110.1 hypothetical protein GCM10007385_13580 [Tateyamaria omphalii]
MTEFVLSDFRNEMVRAFPNVLAMRQMPIVRPDVELAILGWISEQWVTSAAAATAPVPLHRRLRESVSAISVRVAAAVDALAGDFVRAAQRILAKAPAVLATEGIGNIGEVPSEGARPSRMSDPATSVFGRDLGTSQRILSAEDGAEEVLQATLNPDALGAHLAAYHQAVRERGAANDGNAPVPIDALQNSIKQAVEEELRKRSWTWKEKSLWAFAAISAACALFTTVEPYVAQGATAPVAETAISEQVLPAPPVVIVTPLGTPTVTLKELVEVEVFDTLDGEKTGLNVRAQPREASELLYALTEGTRVHIVQYGELGTGYSKVRYLDHKGEYATGWVLTEKLRRVG